METTAYVPTEHDTLLHILRTSPDQVLVKDARLKTAATRNLYGVENENGVFRFIDGRSGIALSAHPNVAGGGHARAIYGPTATLRQAFGFVYNLSATRCSEPLEYVALAIEQGRYALPPVGRHPESEHFLAVTPTGEIHHYLPFFGV